MVQHHDPVLCPCGNNRVLASSRSRLYFMGGGSVSSSSATAAKTSSPASRAFDEQVRAAASGVALVEYPYFIEAVDGRTRAGRTDATGLLPRIGTDASDDYTVHWGDDALARQEQST
jgi:uncharacterized protein (DUF2345 family)